MIKCNDPYCSFQNKDTKQCMINKEGSCERNKMMVHVTGDLMSNPAIAKVLQKPKYPLCYCRLCQGDTQRADCPNKHNPSPPADSVWFRALRGEPIPAVKMRE